MNTDENPEVFDCTNAHLHDLQSIPPPGIPRSIRHADFTCNRLKSIDDCVLELPCLESLSYRQNLLTDVSRLEGLASAPGLKSLELRDNRVEELPDLSRFKSLEYLEVSYNRIADIGGLSKLPSEAGGALKELYVAQNSLRRIQGLEKLAGLRELELGHNKIKSMEGLEMLAALESLWLGSNRIARVDIDMSGFVRLKKLALTSNRLTSMDGLENLVALEELYVSDNGIEELCDLSGLSSLRVLDIGQNRIESLEGVGRLATLTDLWANNNKIEDLDRAEKELDGVKDTLETLYLSGNPFLSIERQAASFKLRMTHLLPKLVQLDDTLVHR
jgi:protein phosphatase 1 regulatory subunit 7